MGMLVTQVGTYSPPSGDSVYVLVGMVDPPRLHPFVILCPVLISNCHSLPSHKALALTPGSIRVGLSGVAVSG